MTVRLSEKLEEKNLASKLSDVVITDLDLGTTAPELTNFSVRHPDPSHVNQALMIDFNLCYMNGNARIGISCNLELVGLKVALKIKVVLKTIQGNANITIPPYPVSRFAFSFFSEPTLVLDIDVQCGKKKTSLTSLPSSIRGIVETKLKEILTEKLIRPNRKYFRLPGSIKIEPPRPKTSIKVTTTLDGSEDKLRGILDLDHIEVQSDSESPVEEGFGFEPPNPAGSSSSKQTPPKGEEERDAMNLHLTKIGSLKIIEKSEKNRDGHKDHKDLEGSSHKEHKDKDKDKDGSGKDKSGKSTTPRLRTSLQILEKDFLKPQEKDKGEKSKDKDGKSDNKKLKTEFFEKMRGSTGTHSPQRSRSEKSVLKPRLRTGDRTPPLKLSDEMPEREPTLLHVETLGVESSGEIAEDIEITVESASPPDQSGLLRSSEDENSGRRRFEHKLNNMKSEFRERFGHK